MTSSGGQPGLMASQEYIVLSAVPQRRNLRRMIFLYLPLAALLLFLLAFTAYCAFPLSWVGHCFGNQPGHRHSEAGALLPGLMLAVYLAVYGGLSLSRTHWRWLKVVAGACAAILAACLVLASQFGQALSGRGDAPSALLWPCFAFEKLVLPATAALRETHYARHLGNGDERLRTIARGQVQNAVARYRQRGLPVPSALVQGLAVGLRSGDALSRRECATILARVGPFDEQVKTLVLQALIDPSWQVRADTADFIADGALEHERDERLLSALLASLERDEVRAVRASSAVALYRSKPNDPRLIEALARSMDQGDALSAVLLRSLSPDDTRVPAAFARFLGDPGADVRLAWVEALEPEALLARDDTSEETEHRGSDWQAALQGVDSGRVPGLQTLLTGLLNDSEPAVRHAVDYQLARLFPQLPEVRDLVSDSDPDTREAIVRGLARSSTGDPAIASALVLALFDDDEARRSLAAGRLTELAPPDPKVQLEMIRALGLHAEPCLQVGQSLLASRTRHREVVAAIANLVANAEVDSLACGIRLLGALHATDPQTQVVLARVICDDEKPGSSKRSVGQRAAEVLSLRKPLSPKARAVLVQAASQGCEPAATLLRRPATHPPSAEDFLEDRELGADDGH